MLRLGASFEKLTAGNRLSFLALKSGKERTPDVPGYEPTECLVHMPVKGTTCAPHAGAKTETEYRECS